MRQSFTVIEGGRSADAPVGDATGSVTWRVDLRRASAVDAAEVVAWRALLVRGGFADPVRADPDYLLTAAEHGAGGRDLVFALAWALGEGAERLEAVVPLALPHTLWGQGRIRVWHPAGNVIAPTIAAGRAMEVREALAERLRALRPGAELVLDSIVAPGVPREVAPRLRAVPARGAIPAHSLVAVRPAHIPAPMTVERISDPERIPGAVEDFLLLDAKISAAPILADPAEAALVRRVTRRFARRHQVSVTLTRSAGAVVAASVTLGSGAQAVLWRTIEGAPARRAERSA